MGCSSVLGAERGWVEWVMLVLVLACCCGVRCRGEAVVPLLVYCWGGECCCVLAVALLLLVCCCGSRCWGEDVVALLLLVCCCGSRCCCEGCWGMDGWGC